jgi:hypothetical protein
MVRTVSDADKPIDSAPEDDLVILRIPRSQADVLRLLAKDMVAAQLCGYCAWRLFIKVGAICGALYAILRLVSWLVQNGWLGAVPGDRTLFGGD